MEENQWHRQKTQGQMRVPSQSNPPKLSSSLSSNLSYLHHFFLELDQSVGSFIFNNLCGLTSGLRARRGLSLHERINVSCVTEWTLAPAAAKLMGMEMVSTGWNIQVLLSAFLLPLVHLIPPFKFLEVNPRTLNSPPALPTHVHVYTPRLVLKQQIHQSLLHATSGPKLTPVVGSDRTGALSLRGQYNRQRGCSWIFLLRCYLGQHSLSVI